MPQPEHHWTRVLPPTLLCALLWGSAFPFIKLVYLEWQKAGLDVGLSDYWWFAGLRFTLAGLVLLLIAKQPWQDLKASPKSLLLSFTLGQTTIQYIFFYLGLAMASGSVASLLVSSGSYWWMLLAPLMLRRPWPTRGQWIAITIGAIGVTIATASPGASANSSLAGIGCLLLATFSGAWGLITFTKLRPTIGAKAATGFSLFAGGILLLLLGGQSLPRTAQLFTPPVILMTCWLSFVSAFAFTLWNHLSTKHPFQLLASYRFLIPLCGVVESLILIPGEHATIALVVGSILVAASLLLAQRFTSGT